MAASQTDTGALEIQTEDSYANHLATINDTQAVRASSDICNTQGQVLVKQGTNIDRATAERVTKFKLQKPLEQSIALDNELNDADLVECIGLYMHSSPSTGEFFDLYNDPQLLLSCCSHLCQFPLIRQKLTVISILTPHVFEQAMFCGWMGMVIAERSKGDQIKPENLFIAGLCHDIGMVHLNADVVKKTTELTIEEWKQIQVHPIISYNIIKDTQGLDPSISRAILEHHENLDGSGYPKGKHFHDLSLEAQIINLLDSVNAIYLKRFKPFNRSIKGLIPIIQINRHSRISHAGKLLILLLKELPDDPTTVKIPDVIAPKIVEVIQERIAYISRCLNSSITAASSLGFQHDKGQLTSIQNAIIHITMTLTQSGFVNDAYKRWVEQVFAEKLTHAYREVEDAYLMMQEIIYHIEKLKLQISTHLENESNGQGAAALQACLDQLNNTQLSEIDPTLAQMWLFKSHSELNGPPVN